MDSILGMLNLHHTWRLFIALYLDSSVSPLLKTYATCGMVYFFSPLDNIPHDFTGNGIIDDLIIMLVIMQAFIEMVPEDVVESHCKRLKIDSRKVLIDVPRMINDAIEMFNAWRNIGGPRGQGRMGPGQAPPGQPLGQGWYYYSPGPGTPGGGWGAGAHPPGETEPPPYSRYSAYREEED